MLDIKEKIRNWLLNNNNTYRIILWFANPIAYSTLPIIAVIMFMSENKIFSYDFFTNGVFGLNTFFIFSTLAILFIGFFLVGFIIPLIALIKQLLNSIKIKEKPDNIIMLLILLLINISLNYALWNNIQEHSAQKTFFIAGILVYFHISILIYCSPKIKLISLIFVTGFLYLLMFLNPTNTSDFVKFGMNKFNITTNTNIIIYNDTNNTHQISEGKLILLTPNKIFISHLNEIQIIERNGKIIKIINDNNSTK